MSTADWWTLVALVAIQAIGGTIWYLKGCPTGQDMPQDWDLADFILTLGVIIFIILGLLVVGFIPAPVWDILEGWILQ